MRISRILTEHKNWSEAALELLIKKKNKVRDNGVPEETPTPRSRRLRTVYCLTSKLNSSN